MPNPLANDLDHILAHTQGLWEEMRGQRVFITGGTGFFGCWILESFCWACDRLKLQAEATVLTRNPTSFRAHCPHLANHPAIRLHTGDVRDFVFPEGPFPFVLHAAADTNDRLRHDDPLRVWNSLTDGTRHMLDFAHACQARRFLLTSTGAVYGKQPAHLTHLPEDYIGGPNPLDPWMAVAEGKRASEMLCALWAQKTGMKILIARAFAFVGPYLPLDVHYAIGNFLRDGLAGTPLVVRGDGTPYRSYLYTADMMIWLWTILLRGQCLRPYNVGSEDALSIADVAQTVARHFPGNLPIKVQQPALKNSVAQRYVPDTARAREELGLQQWVPLDDAIERTLRWHRAQTKGQEKEDRQ